MSTCLWEWARRALAVGLCLLLALSIGTAQEGEKTKKKKADKDPPGTATYMGQLRALFDSWDKNKDEFLDKEELAWAFRGRDARPFDYKRPSKSSEKDKEKETTSEKDKEKEKEGTEPKEKGKEKKPDYSRIPDYNFLVQLDTDGDEKISKPEFVAWARDYATQLKDRDDAVREQLRLQKLLKSNPKKGKGKKSLEQQLKDNQEKLRRLEAKMKRYDAINRGLK